MIPQGGVISNPCVAKVHKTQQPSSKIKNLKSKKTTKINLKPGGSLLWRDSQIFFWTEANQRRELFFCQPNLASMGPPVKAFGASSYTANWCGDENLTHHNPKYIYW